MKRRVVQHDPESRAELSQRANDIGLVQIVGKNVELRLRIVQAILEKTENHFPRVKAEPFISQCKRFRIEIDRLLFRPVRRVVKTIGIRLGREIAARESHFDFAGTKWSEMKRDLRLLSARDLFFF